VADTSRLTRWRCRVGVRQPEACCRGRQARISHETGDLDGLVEWLPTRLIVCRCTERNAFQKDEERAAKLSASDAEVWDPVYEEAISAVMTASGEYAGFQKSQTLASGSVDNSVRPWDAASHRQVGPPLTGHTDAVNSVAFGPDGQTLGSGSWDNGRYGMRPATVRSARH